MLSSIRLRSTGSERRRLDAKGEGDQKWIPKIEVMMSRPLGTTSIAPDVAGIFAARPNTSFGLTRHVNL